MSQGAERINVEGGERTPLNSDSTNRQLDEFDTMRGKLKKAYGAEFDVYFMLAVQLTLLPGIPLIITGIWALVQCTVFFPITAQIDIIVMSALIIVFGVIVIVLTFAFMSYVCCEKPSVRSNLCCDLSKPLFVLLFFSALLLSLGITALVLNPIAQSIEISANSSLFTIHDSQVARDTWNTAQSTLKCCGAMNFTDYEQVFNNYSVPVSCCNTTNPLVNETTCPDIVMNPFMTTDHELIYTEGCVPQLVSYFHYIHTVVGAVTITFGVVLAIYACLIYSHATERYDKYLKGQNHMSKWRKLIKRNVAAN